MLSGVCLRCHGQQKTSGGLRLDSREGLIKGGDSGPAIDAETVDESLVLQAVRRVKGVSAMPPERPLTSQQVADLAAWIRNGAFWPQRSCTNQGGDTLGLCANSRSRATGRSRRALGEIER